MEELIGTVRSPRQVNAPAGPAQVFNLILPDGRGVMARLQATDPLHEGERVILAGDFDNEGVLQAVSVRKPPVPQPVPAKPPGLSFGRIIASALLSLVIPFSILEYLKQNQHGNNSNVGLYIVMILLCPLLGPFLSLFFVRLFGGSLKAGRVWLAPILSVLFILLGYLFLLSSSKTGH